MLYIRLFFEFCKVGLFSVGGGLATIPFLTDMGNRTGWFTSGQMADMIAISESTPGPIAICAATFIGYKTAGFIGAFMATFGVVLPSFVIIFLISIFLREFSSYDIVKYAFTGIRAGVLALIIKAVISMFKRAPKHLLAYIIMALAFTLVVLFSANVLVIILSSAVIGLVASYIARKRGKELK